MADMLVNLLELPDAEPLYEKLKKDYGIYIRRAMTPDKLRIVEWVKEQSGISAAGECDVCFAHHPVSCFIATHKDQVVGYACYNATAPDFFGPTRVSDSQQGKGIGKALLLASLHSLKAEGYVYAIIGGIGPADFYTKTVGAVLIENSTPGIYKDFLPALKG